MSQHAQMLTTLTWSWQHSRVHGGQSVHIQVSKLSSDMCQECELGRKEASAARGEKDTVAATDALALHIRWASEGRECYKCVQEAQQEVELITMESAPF